MKIVATFKSKLPTLKNSLLAIVSAILLILAFPDFEISFLAWIALVPLCYAVEREKDSAVKSFAVGWLFGTIFFFGSCWWLSFPMYQYAGIPSPIAYCLVLMASLTVGLISAIFAALLSVLIKRFGTKAIFAAPFLWTATEFLRFYITGNNWNAIAYSQAFHPFAAKYANLGGIYLVSFVVVYFNVVISLFFLAGWSKVSDNSQDSDAKGLRAGTGRQGIIFAKRFILVLSPLLIFYVITSFTENQQNSKAFDPDKANAYVVAIQPNVPMSGLKSADWQRLRDRHVQLSEQALQSDQLKNAPRKPTVVIFPESPMNFEYTRDQEFQQFLRGFASRNKVSVLFNAAEPSLDDGIYNSAVLVNQRAERIGQYDKIHLLPFGEFVPLPGPIAEMIPPVVGNFEFGKSYDLLPFGDVQAGIMICFESHFPTLSREFALEGADVIVEITNDGYLGNTGVLRQHLANAVFRAVETNRPVVRVTNIGISAFINERGEISDATKSYVEDTRVWTIAKSDGRQTFYVKYGDWFAWVCAIVSLGLLIFSFKNSFKKKENSVK